MKKKITSEKYLYTQLARRGDPAAFYALFGWHIRSFYILLRSRGLDHQAACDDAVQVVTLLYRKFVKHRPHRAQKWFAGKCGLRKFDATAAGSVAAEADITDYGRQINATLNRSYSELLDRSGNRKWNIVNEPPPFPRVIIWTVGLVLTTFLFFSGFVLSISFERFNKEYRLSFPNIAGALWNLSGFVHSVDAEPEHTGETTPAPAAGTESTGNNE
jgi:hypothetical protein